MKSTSKAAAGPRPGPEPAEDIRYLVRRLADDRRLPERARLVAQQLIGGQKQFELAAANSARREAPRHAPSPARRGSARARPGDGALGRKGGTADVEGSRSRGRFASCASSTTSSHRPGARSPGGDEALSRRRGRGYDPQVVDAALAEPGVLLGAADVLDAWERHRSRARAGGDDLSRGARDGRPCLCRVRRSQGHLRGHSTRVAELAANAAEALGCSSSESSGGSRRGPLPRSRAGIGAERDLGEARSLERGRVGAGSPPSLLHRAGAGALPAFAPLALLAGLTTSASTAPATTAEPPPLSSASAPACWQRPTLSTR